MASYGISGNANSGGNSALGTMVGQNWNTGLSSQQSRNQSQQQSQGSSSSSNMGRSQGQSTGMSYGQSYNLGQNYSSSFNLAQPAQQFQNYWQGQLSNLQGKQYQWAQQQAGNNQQVTDAAVGNYLKGANMAQGFAQGAMDQYSGTYQPLNAQFAQEAQNYANPGFVQQQQGAAESGAAQAAQASLNNTKQQLQSMGIDASSPRYAGALAQANATAGASEAAAGQQAALATKATGLQLQQAAIGQGQQVASMGLSGANVGYQGTAGMENAALANTQTSGNILGTSQGYAQLGNNIQFAPIGTRSYGQTVGKSQQGSQQQSTQNAYNVGSSQSQQSSSGSSYGESTGQSSSAGGGGGQFVPKVQYGPGVMAGGGAVPAGRINAASGGAIPSRQCFASGGAAYGQSDGSSGAAYGNYKGSSYGGSAYGSSSGMSVDAYGDQTMRDRSYGTPHGWDYGMPPDENYASGGQVPYDSLNGDTAVRSYGRGGASAPALPGRTGPSNPDATTGGFVSQALSPSQGRVTDDVPANLNADEFVIPRDVVKWNGQKFYQDHINKSRMDQQKGTHAAPTNGPAPPGSPGTQGQKPMRLKEAVGHMQAPPFKNAPSAANGGAIPSRGYYADGGAAMNMTGTVNNPGGAMTSGGASGGSSGGVPKPTGIYGTAPGASGGSTGGSSAGATTANNSFGPAPGASGGSSNGATGGTSTGGYSAGSAGGSSGSGVSSGSSYGGNSGGVNSSGGVTSSGGGSSYTPMTSNPQTMGGGANMPGSNYGPTGVSNQPVPTGSLTGGMENQFSSGINNAGATPMTRNPQTMGGGPMMPGGSPQAGFNPHQAPNNSFGPAAFTNGLTSPTGSYGPPPVASGSGMTSGANAGGATSMTNNPQTMGGMANNPQGGTAAPAIAPRNSFGPAPGAQGGQPGGFAAQPGQMGGRPTGAYGPAPGGLANNPQQMGGRPSGAFGPPPGAGNVQGGSTGGAQPGAVNRGRPANVQRGNQGIRGQAMSGHGRAAMAGRAMTGRPAGGYAQAPNRPMAGGYIQASNGPMASYGSPGGGAGPASSMPQQFYGLANGYMAGGGRVGAI